MGQHFEFVTNRLRGTLANLRPVSLNIIKRGMMEIHSKFLVHWTKERTLELLRNQKSRLYVRTIQDNLEKGHFTRRAAEDPIRYWKIKIS